MIRAKYQHTFENGVRVIARTGIDYDGRPVLRVRWPSEKALRATMQSESSRVAEWTVYVTLRAFVNKTAKLDRKFCP